MSKWLVTGGAGYIGAHVVRAFTAAGIEVVVVDNLSSGHPNFLDPHIPLVGASILDTDTLSEVMRTHEVTGVVHLAAFKYAGVSVQRPLHTYEQNISGTVSVLQAMEAAGVKNIVFSSSAAVYGTPDVDLVTEETPTNPESPYGRSKLVDEWVLADQGLATGLRHTALRYFNVVGSGTPEIYDTSPYNLFPIVLRKLQAGETPTIFGDDFATPDGTCVRDYVDVADVAQAHVAAAQALAAGHELLPAYNLGSGEGVSVKQIMSAIAAATGIDFTPQIGPRRAGDPAKIVASGEAAARDLGWTNTKSLEPMISQAWQAQQHAQQAPPASQPQG